LPYDDLVELGMSVDAALQWAGDVPAAVTYDARRAFAARRPDASLASIVYDSRDDGNQADDAIRIIGVADRMRVDLDITTDHGRSSLCGHCEPPWAGRALAESPTGVIELRLLEDGGFAGDDLPAGLLRLGFCDDRGHCEVVTEWVRVTTSAVSPA
jgi:hypothetical protein